MLFHRSFVSERWPKLKIMQHWNVPDHGQPKASLLKVVINIFHYSVQLMFASLPTLIQCQQNVRLCMTIQNKQRSDITKPWLSTCPPNSRPWKCPCKRGSDSWRSKYGCTTAALAAYTSDFLSARVCRTRCMLNSFKSWTSLSTYRSVSSLFCKVLGFSTWFSHILLTVSLRVQSKNCHWMLAVHVLEGTIISDLLPATCLDFQDPQMPVQHNPGH